MKSTKQSSASQQETSGQRQGPRRALSRDLLAPFPASERGSIKVVQILVFRIGAFGQPAQQSLVQEVGVEPA